MQPPRFYLLVVLSAGLSAAACDDGARDDEGAGGSAGSEARGGAGVGSAGGHAGRTAGEGGVAGSAGESGFGQGGTAVTLTGEEIAALCSQQCQTQSALPCANDTSCDAQCAGLAGSDCMPQYHALLACTAEMTEAEWICPDMSSAIPAVAESTACEERNCAYVRCFDAALGMDGASSLFPQYIDRCYP